MTLALVTSPNSLKISRRSSVVVEELSFATKMFIDSRTV
jgi:hypothetical protein